MTTHDLARQEKQKLELLRGLLTYYHYASTESRQEVLQVEINQINAAANEQRDRYRSQFTVQQEAPQRRGRRPRWRSTSCRRSNSSGTTGHRSSGTRGCHRRMTSRRLRMTARNRRTTTMTPRPG